MALSPAHINDRDRDRLRRLAARVREFAMADSNASNWRRWQRLNDLQHEGPPLVLVSPEGAWVEIEEGFDYKCGGELARSWEKKLLQVLYKREVIRDDSTCAAAFDISWRVEQGHFGFAEQQQQSDTLRGSYHIDAVVEDLQRDIARLHVRQRRVERASSLEEFAAAERCFGDILSVRMCGSIQWTVGLTWDAIRLIGLENLMLYMYDQPEALRQLMALLARDISLYMDFLEEEEILSYNTGCNYIGSGNIGHSTQLPSYEAPVDRPLKMGDVWGFAESQETVGISPDMFGEFIFPYQKENMQRFGLSYYGCCEPVEERFDYIKEIENLRCLSVSPWSDQERCAELLARDYVYCRKPNPSPICVGFLEDAIRRDIRETLRCAGTLNTVLVLKDTHTVEHEPERFRRLVEIAREEMDTF